VRKPEGSTRVEHVPAGLEASRMGEPSSPERDAEWVALVADGWSYAAVGFLYGVTKGRVHQVIRRSRP
jgi:hypothetical protein